MKFPLPRRVGRFCPLYTSTSFLISRVRFGPSAVGSGKHPVMNARFLTLILITAFVAACGRVDRELAGTWRITRSISQGKETQAAADRASRRNFDDGVAVTLHPTLIAGKPYEVTGRARYSV